MTVVTSENTAFKRKAGEEAKPQTASGLRATMVFGGPFQSKMIVITDGI